VLLICQVIAPSTSNAMTDYAIAFDDTSPPLYLQHGILRL